MVQPITAKKSPIAGKINFEIFNEGLAADLMMINESIDKKSTVNKANFFIIPSSSSFTLLGSIFLILVTRKKVNKWKTGFYYIALKAELPILMVSFDYDRKEVKINDKFNPTGNIESDFNVLENMVSDVVFRNKI